MAVEDIFVTINENTEEVTVIVKDFSTSNILSNDAGNIAVLGTDGGVFVPESGGGSGTVKSVNSILPDGNGNVDVPIPTVPSFADQTETNAGTVTDKTISPNTLAGWWTYAKTLAQTFTQKITFNFGALFTPIATPNHERGRVYFDDVNDCISFMDSISGTSVQVGYETLMRARNNTGTTILNGSVVYISGSVGQNPTIALARANAETTSEIIGVATHDIANNAVGKVCVFGLVNDVNTSAFLDGDFVYLSSSVSGGLTKTPPASPNFVVSVGVIEHSHVTQGKILVKPQRALSNNNTLGTSQKVGVTENVLKTNLDTKQNVLGYTPENVANKATSLASPDNTKYPTTQAVKTALDLKQDTLTAVNLGAIIDTQLAIKMTPSANDEIVTLDSITGEAVTIKFSSFGGGSDYLMSEYKVDGNLAVSANWVSWYRGDANYDQSMFRGGSFGSGSTVVFSSAIVEAIPRGVPAGHKLDSILFRCTLGASTGTTTFKVECHTNESVSGAQKTTLLNNQLLVQQSWTGTANAFGKVEFKQLTVNSHNTFTANTLLYLYLKVEGTGSIREINFLPIFKKQ